MSTIARTSSRMPLALLGGTLLLATDARALDSQWYLGFGGSVARLAPDADLPGLEAEIEPVGGGTVFIGRDLDERSSVQLQLHGLGEATFEDGEEVLYSGGDAAVLYRFVDSRDGARRGRGFGASLYGRFGLGIIERESDVPLDGDGSVHFGVGVGTEIYLSRNLALRAEGIFHENDASSANVALVTRFGGRARDLPLAPPLASTRPAPTTSSATATIGTDGDRRDAATTQGATRPVGATARARSGMPAANAGERGATRTASVPAVAAAAPAAEDRDGDGVADAVDVCPRSAAGYPVRENGCALLDGVLSGVRFAEGSAEFEAGALKQLDYLADLLGSYPRARVELLAHTDDRGTLREQSILTRARLRTVAIHLVHERGIRSNRLLLRSFGGARPLYDNATPEGRAANNRIEIVENPS